MKNVQTGYFARAHENGHSAKYTKTHLTYKGKPMCGYIPHKTMQFQMNAMGPHLEYLECTKCREALQVHFEIDSYEQMGSERFVVNFPAIFGSVNVSTIIKGVTVSHFHKKDDAVEYGKECVRHYKAFMRKTGGVIPAAVMKKTKKITSEYQLVLSQIIHDTDKHKNDVVISRIRAIASEALKKY